MTSHLASICSNLYQSELLIWTRHFIFLYLWSSKLSYEVLPRAAIRSSGGGGLVAKSCPTLTTLWTVAHQAPLSMGFSRPEYWSGLPFPTPGDLPNPGVEPGLLHCRQILY